MARGGRLWLHCAPWLETKSGPEKLGLVQLVETLRTLSGSAPGPAWEALAKELLAASEVQAAAYATALGRPVPQHWDDFEAWTPEGHNLHPGAKTREGFSKEDMLAYAPDFSQRIALPWIAVHRDLLLACGDVPDIFEHSPDHWALPVHPWQRREILGPVYAEAWRQGLIRDLSRQPLMAALSTSLRTVHPLDTSLPLLKLSVGSLMTSTERSMSRHTVLQGPIYSEILSRALNDAPSWWAKNVEAMPESGGLCWADPNAPVAQTRQLSLLFRQRPDVPRGLTPVPCSTLPQPYGAPNLQSTVLSELFSRGDGPLANLRRYCQLLIPCHLGLYQEWGLALEAHLQNCVVLWSAVGPERLWLRDWGGLRANPRRLRRRAPELVNLLDPQSLTLSPGWAARRKLIACLYSNHLTEIITGLVRAFDLNERLLWSVVLETTTAALRAWPGCSLAREITECPWPVKSLLRMRLKPKAGDLYSFLPNPLPQASGAEVNDLGLDSHRAAS
jgi:siderophore synthetase component